MHVAANENMEKGISPKNGFSKKDLGNYAPYSRINNFNSVLNGMSPDVIITE